MIKVNLIGESRKKPVKTGTKIKIPVPTNAMPLILALIVGGAAVGGYLWYSSLSGRIAELDKSISAAQAQKASLDAIIKADQVYEVRKKTLENRIKVVEGLQRNQVNPVFAMEELS